MQKPCLPPNCGRCTYSWRRSAWSCGVACFASTLLAAGGMACSCNMSAGLLPVAMVIEMFEQHASRTSSFRLCVEAVALL